MGDLVSIVIPAYNAEKYLDEAISSCLEQTYSNIEIIAVDDGSTDNSLEILKNYEDKIKIKSQENKGVSAATNLGISSMKGLLFKIMNADDIFYPNCVELLVNEFEKLGDNKAIIHGDGIIIDGGGNLIREFHHIDYNDLSQFERNVILLHRNMVTNITSLFHRNAFTQCGVYDESLLAAVDYELWLRLCIQYDYKLHLISKKLVKWRVEKNKGITANALKKKPNYGEEVRNLVLNRLNINEREKYETALNNYIKKNQTTLGKNVKRSSNKWMEKIFRFTSSDNN